MDLGPAYVRAEQAQHHIYLVNAVKKDATPLRFDVAGASRDQSLNRAELAHLFAKGPGYEACLGSVEKEQTGTPNSSARAKKRFPSA